MTPQERQLIDGLFDKLAGLEQTQRDADANAAITAGLRRAPNAAYALVQTVLLQDEALKRANDRILELESLGQNQPQGGGFLDSMRDTLFGGSNGSRGSVPNVRPNDNARGPTWNSGQVIGQQPMQQGGGYGQAPFGGAPQQQAGGGGGSFLGTAAAAAAGVVGGSLLMSSIRGLMGGSQHGFGDQASLGRSGSDSAGPWSGGGNGSNDLARDAGVNDIGRNAGGNDQRQGFADQQPDNNSYDTASHDDTDDSGDDFDDSDFDGGGDSDYA